VSGAGVIAAPARLPGRAAPTAPASPRQAIARALAWVLAHPLLDRLVRGRVWVLVISFALIGIVAMQLWVLKLNSGIGRAIEHEALLQRENAALSIENSALASGFRAEARAAGAGMVPIPPGGATFLTSRGQRDVREAARVLKQPLQNVLASSLTSPASSTSETALANPTTVSTGQELPAATGSPAAPTAEGQTTTAAGEVTPATGQPEATTPAAGATTPAAGTEQATAAQGGTATAETATATGETAAATGDTGRTTGETGTATGATGTAGGGVPTVGEGLDTGGQATPGTAEPVREAAGGVPR
jgi:hypothetical protein